jgi:predicted Zn-dependent peptidase
MSFLQTIPEIHSLADGVTLLGVADQRFKRALVQVLFELPLDASRAARSLLLDVLEQGSRQFPDSTSLACELQNLYGASCEVYSERSCEAHRVGLQVSCLGAQFLPPGEDVLLPALNLISDVLFDPLRGEQNGELFNAQYLELERKNLLDMLAERQDNRSAYATERFLSVMCADEDYGKLSWESSEAIAGLTPQQLEDARREIIDCAKVIIICSGSVNVNIVKHWATQRFSGQRNIIDVAEPSTKFPSELRHVNEHLEMKQAQLHIGLRLTLPESIANREALAAACSVLGGGSHGRLFQKIREEKSLAYGIYSQMHGRKHILSVQAGIDAQSAAEVEEEVFTQIDLLANEGPTAHEVELAKANRLNGLASLADSPGAMASFYHADYLLGLNATPAIRADACNALTAEQIQQAACGWQADLVYLLSAAE